MKHFRIQRALGLLLGICLLLQLITALASCGKKEDVTRVTAITSVELNKSGERVSVQATLSESDAALYKNGTICLFALEPFQNFDSAGGAQLTPVAESRGAESMRFQVDFNFDNGTRNRLTQRFLLASRDENGVYSALTDGVYISNPEILSEGSAPTASDTLKGVAISASDDVSLIAPSHVVIDVPLEHYIQNAPEKGETISYLYAGETISLSETAVDTLDEQIRSLTVQGALIYLRPILTSSPDALGDLSVLGYAGASEARAYALNPSNEKGCFYIAGFFSFLAERYASVSGVIPGVTLNSARYNSSTITSFEINVSNTLSLMRMAHNIFRAKHADVQVYLPVSNLFTTDERLGATERGTREFLAAFSTYAKKSGDFDWAIYLLMETTAPTVETIYTESGTVNDGGVTEKYVFPQTVSLMQDLLSTKELVYGSAKRRMIWALSTSGSGDAGLENQCATLFYTYMKALAHNSAKTGADVRAVVWETLRDSEASSAGLIAENGTLKPSGKLFLQLGRADLTSAVDLSGMQAKLGTRYGEISSVVGKAESVTIYSGTAVSGMGEISENSQSTLLFGDSAGFGTAFSTLPGSGVYTIRRPNYDTAPVLEATFDSEVGCGVYTNAISGNALKDRNKFVVTLAAKLPEGYSQATVRISLENTSNGKVYRYVGEGRVGSEVTALVFDVKDFAKKIDDDEPVAMTISLIDTGATAETPISFCVAKVESYETRNWFVRGGWVIFLVAVILIALTVLLIWFFQTYEVRWTSNGERGKKAKRQAQPGVPLKERLAKLWAGILDRTQIRPRSRSRILVKPDSNPDGASEPADRGFDDPDDLNDAEELEELFDAGDGSEDNEDTADLAEDSDNDSDTAEEDSADDVSSSD